MKLIGGNVEYVVLFMLKCRRWKCNFDNIVPYKPVIKYPPAGCAAACHDFCAGQRPMGTTFYIAFSNNFNLKVNAILQ